MFKVLFTFGALAILKANFFFYAWTFYLALSLMHLPLSPLIFCPNSITRDIDKNMVIIAMLTHPIEILVLILSIQGVNPVIQ